MVSIITLDELNKNEQTILRSAIFNLHYVSAESISKVLKPAGLLSTHGKLGAEAGSNSLVIADTGDKIMAVKQLLKQIDVPAKQILIEARIVNADESFLQRQPAAGAGVTDDSWLPRQWSRPGPCSSGHSRRLPEPPRGSSGPVVCA